MSGIGDQGMMPEHVHSQHPDDDTTEEGSIEEHTATAGDDELGRAEMDEVLSGVADDERDDVSPAQDPDAAAEPHDRREP